MQQSLYSCTDSECAETTDAWGSCACFLVWRMSSHVMERSKDNRATQLFLIQKVAIYVQCGNAD